MIVPTPGLTHAKQKLKILLNDREGQNERIISIKNMQASEVVHLVKSLAVKTDDRGLQGDRKDSTRRRDALVPLTPKEV